MAKKLTYNISALPLWAQDLITEKDREIAQLKENVANIQKAHTILTNRPRWVTILGPHEHHEDTGTAHWPDVYHLWFLDRDHPITACSLMKGDVLLVGRAERDWEKAEASA